jgi:D-alanyl-D-alanine carboxypeptidase
VWSYKDRLSYIFEDEAVHEAGKGWAYSDTGYLLIGMLVEKFVGNYYETVNKELLVANNLTSTYGAISRDLPNLATGYSDLSDFFAPKVTVENGRYYFNPQMEWTGGGVVSTTSDLAKWAKIYFDGDVFSDSLKQLIITPSEQGKNLDEVTSCGAGGFVYNLKAGKFFGHTGLMPGYRSIFSYSPELDIAIAIQTNCDFGNTKMSLTDFVDFIILND